MSTILNVYIVHYTKLKKREEHMDKFVNILKDVVTELPIVCNFVIIRDSDPENIKDINKLANMSLIENPTEKDKVFNGMLKQLTPNNISNSMKHLKALETISEYTNNNEIHLVIEDDILYSKEQITNFCKNIKNIHTNYDYDMMFLGLPHANIKTDDSKFFICSTSTNQKENLHMFPCCDSYIIRPDCARTICKHFLPIKFETNIHLSYIVSTNFINAQKCFPNFVADGSKLGMFSSTINPNNILIHNNNYKIAYNILNQEFLTPNDEITLNTIFNKEDSMKIPDFQYLIGIYKMKQKNYDVAEKIFGEVYTKYKENLVPMNNNSLFLKNYMNIYKFLQIY